MVMKYGRVILPLRQILLGTTEGEVVHDYYTEETH